MENYLNKHHLQWENLQINLELTEVTYLGKIVTLTSKEYKILKLLVKNPRRIFSRSVILDLIWDDDHYPNEETVTTHIKCLRQKLKAVGMTQDIIETVYGLGYRMKIIPKNQHQNQSLLTEKVEILLIKIWQEYQETFTNILVLFETLVNNFYAHKLSENLRSQAHAEAHKLAGTLGSFGFPEGSEIAKEIEAILQNDQNISIENIDRMKKLINLLKLIIQQKPKIGYTYLSNINNGKILLIDDDIILAKNIKNAGKQFGLEIEIINNLDEAKTAITNTDHDLILLDINFPETAETGLNILAQLHEQKSTIPVLMMSSTNDMSDRLTAARLGAFTFLKKPLSLPEIFQAINEALNYQTLTEAKIMIVDDDQHLLTILQTILQPWGLQVTTLAHPENFWQVLEQTSPDLLILDIEMPHYNGIDLCTIVRNDAKWQKLPILFLSAHTNREILHQVFTVGADDYIHKPIIEPELIARVLNRLERAKLGNPLKIK
jgi:DNA-binding response OmpR family regulator/HPt (histidine-containing phosphotransfer) domain-containing protein